MNSIYRQTVYTTSAQKLSQLPDDTGIEVAIAGRSNAGKSSAINAMTDQNGLAKVSKTPGRTQMINFFQIEEGRHLVDLPGYGYAKVPLAVKKHWVKTLESYLAQRECLKGLFVVMDIRHPLRDQDWQMVRWAHGSNVPLHVLLTKADKLKRGAAMAQLHQVLNAFEAENINASLQLFSSLKKQGIDDAHSVLDEWFGYSGDADTEHAVVSEY